MANFPKTRISLILRLACAEDVQAWQEFSELYAPILFRLAKRKGLQAADAEDVTQDILFAFARASERFRPDASRAQFRTWLCSIARNLIADFFAGRAKRPVSQSLNESWLHSIADGIHGSCHDSDEFDSAFGLEHRRAIFSLAARRIQSRVSESSWLAFHSTAVLQISAEQVARELGLSPGAVYVSRCRILKMLRCEVERMNQSNASLEKTQ